MTQTLPVQANKRIYSLDIIRGVAVLGILLMNIQSFSMINAAYINPTLSGDFTGVNRVVWIIVHLFADQKFLSIFSILFGAGIILFSSKKDGSSLVKLHYKRIFWLLIFGLLHAYLLWHGDILVTYAICGLWVFLLRKKKPKTLITIGVILIAIPFLLNLFSGFSMQYMPEEGLEGFRNSWSPDADYIQNEIAAFKGIWSDQMEFRVDYSLEFQTFLFLYLFGWKASGLMLIGMALFKNGVLSNKKSRKYYRNMAFIGISAGLLISGLGVITNFANNWSMEYSMTLGSTFNYWGSICSALGYIGLISLLASKKVMHFLFQHTGQMAFTSYLLQSLICTFIFYGHGLGLFAELNQLEQLGIVLITWIIVVAFANIWLKYYRFGPVEWLWRTLTYGRLLGMRKEGVTSN